MSDSPQIAAHLTALVVSVDSVKLHPLNPRRGDIPAIMDSLQRFGQMKPIVVHDETGYVIAGNHTLQAAQRLGWKEIAVVRESMQEDEATKYMLADNKAADRARYKKTELHNLLQQTLDLEGTGFDIDDVEDLEAELGANEDDGFGADDEGGEKAAPKKLPAPERKAPAAQPMREVVMLMPQDAAIQFGLHIAHLQGSFGTSTVVDTVRRAVQEAAEAAGYKAPEPEAKAEAKPKRKARGAAAKTEAQQAIAKAKKAQEAAA